MTEINFETENNRVSYQRITHSFSGAWDSYLNKNHSFLEHEESDLIQIFKKPQDAIEANIFLEIDLEKLLESLDFHIIAYEDYSSYKDPVETKQLLFEVKNLSENVLKNIESNMLVAQNLGKINSMKIHLTNSVNNINQEFAKLEASENLSSQTEELMSLFVASKQVMEKYAKLIIKIKQFELYYCQNAETLLENTNNFNNESVTYERIEFSGSECEINFSTILSTVCDLLTERFEKENTKLVK